MIVDANHELVKKYVETQPDYARDSTCSPLGVSKKSETQPVATRDSPCPPQGAGRERETLLNDAETQLYSPLGVSKKSETRGGGLKKYYIISGETIKMILMTVRTAEGEKVRRYYLNIERLAKFITKAVSDYNKEMVTKITEENIKTNKANMHFKNHLKQIAIIEPTQYVYITASYDDACNNVFKYGGSSSIAKLKERENKYNTGRSVTMPMRIITAIRCHNYRFIEACIKNFLRAFHENENIRKENVNMNFYDLFDILLDIVKFCEYMIQNKLEDKIHSYIDNMYGSSVEVFDLIKDRKAFDFIEYKSIRDTDAINDHEPIKVLSFNKDLIVATNKPLIIMPDSACDDVADDTIVGDAASDYTIDDVTIAESINDLTIDDSTIDDSNANVASASASASAATASATISADGVSAVGVSAAAIDTTLDKLIKILDSLVIPNDKCDDVVIQKTFKHFREILIQAVKDNQADADFRLVTAKLSTRERAKASGVSEIKKLIKDVIRDTSLQQIIKIKFLGK